jgi:membrane fusion protein, macrolide-specific efflux system
MLKRVIQFFREHTILFYLFFIFVIIGITSAVYSGLKNNKSAASPVVSEAVDAVYALGTVKSDSLQIIKAGISGIILKRHVKEGERVIAGQSLLTTDSATLRSSVNGIVTKLTVNQNDTLIMGQELIRVTDINKLFIVIALDQKSILFVREGQPAEISFEGMREKKIKGVVLRAYPTPDNAQFLVRVDSKEIPEGVLPEMTCDVVIETGRRKDAVFVPAEAVHKGKMTFIQNGRKQTVSVVTGAKKDKLIEIKSPPVFPEDKIIIRSDSH